MPIKVAVVSIFMLVASVPASAEGDVVLESLEPYVFEVQDQKIDAEYGWISVPESHFESTGNRIRLPFVRFKATTPNPGSSLVYLAGGPGGSGIATARSVRFHLFMKLREAGDVIVLDQRGTGAAEPSLLTKASWSVATDRPADYDEWTPAVREAIAGVVEDFSARGIHLEHYNTKESAADVDALRRALGLEKISLWGTSYGTHLSTAIMRYHGEGIDRVILTGAEGPDHTLKLPSTTQKHLEIVADLIRDDPKLSEHIPDFVGMVQKVLEDLEVKPVTITMRGGRKITIGRLDLEKFISESVGRRGSIRPLPMMIYEVAHGEYRRIAGIAYSTRQGSIQSAMSLAMDCASGASPERLARIAREEEETLLGNTMNFPYDRACQDLGLADLGEEFRGPLRSEIPVLFISGTLDGRTPIANAEELREGLPNSYHIIVENVGHDEELFSLAPGLGDRMVAFLGGDAPSEERITMEPIEFVGIRPR